MPASCKTLKILSLLIVLLGIVGLIVGGTLLFGAGAVADVEGVESPVATAQALGIVFMVTGAFHLALGFMGTRGANNPAKLGGFIVLCAILVVANIVEAVLGFSSSNWLPSAVSALAALIALVFARRAKSEAHDL